MESIRSDMEGGFRALMQDQSDGLGCVVSLIDFDNEAISSRFTAVSSSNVTQLGLVPRGMTPLFDAMVEGIDRTGKRLAALPASERPDKVVFITITDGAENASITATAKQVAKAVKHQRTKYGWEFLYLGANADVIADAGRVGVVASMATCYVANSVGVRNMFAAASSALTSYQMGVQVNIQQWTPDLRTDAFGDKPL